MKHLIVALVISICLFVPYGYECAKWKDPVTKLCCLKIAKY